MKKVIRLFVLMAGLFLLAGCSASDPLDPVYLSGLYVVDGGDAGIGGSLDVEGNIDVAGSIIKSSAGGGGGYYHEYSLSAINLSPGASGSTLIAPNASSLGGYQFNAIGEYLFFDSHVEGDWDEISDGFLEIYFEVNDDNSGGLATDTVDLQLEVWHKKVGENSCTVYSLSESTIVGTATQHDLFEQHISVGNLRMREVLSFRLNLNTIASEVDDIIINYIEFKYPTYYPAGEVN